MIKGLIVGTFDLLHPGHLYTLAKCKEYCDYLVVGLQVNPHLERKDKNKPVETIFERWLRLDSCKYVDLIVPYETETDVINWLATTNCTIRFNGEDHANKDKPSERDIMCNEMGIQIIYIPRRHGWSTTKLRERIK